MKKNFALTTLVILCLNVLYGQTITTKAQLKKLHPSFRKSGYSFKWDEHEAYILSLPGISGITMGKVQTGDEKAPKSKKIETPGYNGQKIHTRSAFNIGRNVYIKAYTEDTKTDQVTYLLFRVNLQNFSIDPAPVVIDTYTDVKGQDMNYDFEVIDDRSLLVTKFHTVKKDNVARVTYLMFDEKLNKLWEREIVPPMQDKHFYIERYDFHDENTMLMTCVEYPDGVRRAKKKGLPNYKYHLYLYTNKMQDVKDFELDLEGKFITDVSAGINQNGQLICAGFYSRSGFYDLTGCFYMSINTQTRKVEKTSIQEFDNEFNLSLMNKRQKRKAKRKEAKGDDIEAPDFDLRHLYYDEKGNVLMIAEDYYVVTHCVTDSKGYTRCYDTYHYDDLIAVAINSDGDIVWNTKIDKKLTFRYKIRESFLTIHENGKWIFVYNENLKNLEKDAVEKETGEEDDGYDRSASRRNSAPVIVVLDEDGKYTKEVLMMPGGKRSVSITTTGEPIQLKDGGYIIELDEAGGESFYRLDLKI